MSLNRYEQTIFDYWEQQPDERRHWQQKVVELTRGGVSPEQARALERELWTYLVERTPHVRALKNLAGDSLPRVSLLSLAEHILRLWGPIPKPRKPAGPSL